MQVKNKITLFCLLLLISTRAFCIGDEDELEKPSYPEVILKNAIVPGLGFKMLGNDKEARLYYAALPLNLIGAGLVTAAVFLHGNSVVLDMKHSDGVTNVLQYKNELTPTAKLMLAGGIGIGLYGNLLAAYSSYAVHSDYVERYGFPGGFPPPDTARISLTDALTAPFTPAHVFNIDVLPMIGLATLGSFSVEDYGQIGAYFQRDHVDFLGFPVTPLAGLGLEILLAGCLVTANAAWEELAYRGLSLQVNGPIHSSLSFGFAHLTNMLAPGASVEGTLMQTVFATAFGFYAADRVQHGKNGLQRMIALHFWNNLLSMVLGFLADPESGGTLSVKIRL
jgi:hypothetical protein